MKAEHNRIIEIEDDFLPSGNKYIIADNFGKEFGFEFHEVKNNLSIFLYLSFYESEFHLDIICPFAMSEYSGVDIYFKNEKLPSPLGVHPGGEFIKKIDKSKYPVGRVDEYFLQRLIHKSISKITLTTYFNKKHAFRALMGMDSALKDGVFALFENRFEEINK